MCLRRVRSTSCPARRDNILTVAMCGFTCSRAQLARYTGPDGVVVLQNWACDGYAAEEDEDENEDDSADTAEILSPPPRRSRKGGGPGFFYQSVCDIAPRILHHVMASPEVCDIVHPTRPSLRCARTSVNPIHWLLAVKSWLSCKLFRVSPCQLCYSELGRINMGGCRDQAAFTREIRRAVCLLRRDEQRCGRCARQKCCTGATGQGRERLDGEDGSTGWGPDQEDGCSLAAPDEARRSREYDEKKKEAATTRACERERGRVANRVVEDWDEVSCGIDEDAHVATRDERDARRCGTNRSCCGDVCVKCVPPPRRCRHLVLFGVSRGATTCFYAAMKLGRELAAYVSLVILEAPFDTLEHVMRASCWFPRVMMALFRCFGDYTSEDELREAYSFDPGRVNLRCPVAFVISAKDSRVPNECTHVLIDALRTQLVPHVIPAVEVLVLKHSAHPRMPFHHEDDQDAYVRFVEQLYDKYCPY